jgi:hypothetical protein
LNRFDEARQIAEQALQRFPSGEFLHWGSYIEALTAGRPADAQPELDWAKGKPGEFRFTSVRASFEARAGKLLRARELMQEAIEMEKSLGLKEGAEADLGVQALIEADLGACDRARKDAGLLGGSPGRSAAALAGFAFATCGESKKAAAFANDLNKKYPLETFAQKEDIPQIRARLDLQRGDGAKAVDDLRIAEPYQFGNVAAGIPAYLRGLAYLKMKQGGPAAAEFQKIIEHKGLMGVSPYFSLAKLGLGRAFALTGDAAKARTAYQDFFAIWKDADSDIPILKEAKAEYEKLK